MELVIFDTSLFNNSQPRGIAFNSSGLKMYITDDRQNSGIDEIIEYDLKCPFNIIQANVLQLLKIMIDMV